MNNEWNVFFFFKLVFFFTERTYSREFTTGRSNSETLLLIQCVTASSYFLTFDFFSPFRDAFFCSSCPVLNKYLSFLLSLFLLYFRHFCLLHLPFSFFLSFNIYTTVSLSLSLSLPLSLSLCHM